MAIFSSKNDLPSPLTSIERAELAKLEGMVETGIRAFATAGKALARIRERQLFRESHNSFEQYVADRWSMSRQHAERLIAAADVVANLAPTGAGAVPLSEFQARKLAPLPADAQREVWAEVVDAAPKDSQGNPVVTAATIEAAVSKRSPKGKKRKARPKPTRIKVPGATVIVVPNAKFVGTPVDALRSAVAKLAGGQQSKAA